MSAFSTQLDILPCIQKKVKDTLKAIEENQLSFLIFNVLQKNENYEGLHTLVRNNDPDIVLLLETGKEWDRASDSLKNLYPYTIKEIREDTYGIKLISKLELIESRINKFVLEGVPSAEVLVYFGARPIRIFGIHPKPPIPGEKLYSTSKDKEILRVGNKVNHTPEDEEKIVIGDLNDVAWSRISRKFKNLTGLEDPREGRGFYSTFPAYSPFKFPLDHLFLSDGFTLVQFEVLPSYGSDHHPLYIKLQLKE